MLLIVIEYWYTFRFSRNAMNFFQVPVSTTILFSFQDVCGYFVFCCCVCNYLYKPWANCTIIVACLTALTMTLLMMKNVEIISIGNANIIQTIEMIRRLETQKKAIKFIQFVTFSAVGLVNMEWNVSNKKDSRHISNKKQRVNGAIPLLDSENENI